MMKRYLAYGLAALLTLFSCSREETATEYGGTISIRFSTMGLQETKAVTPGDSTVADGGGIYRDGSGNPDLVILIANSEGSLVVKYPTHGTLQSSTSTEATIKFDFSAQPAGEYTVYAFGNTEGLWEMTTDGTDSYSGATLTTLTTAAQVEALRFKDQWRNTIGWKDAGYDALPAEKKYDEGIALKNGRLPVSAKASLTVSAGKNGEAYLELIRCVAKVTAVMINNTGVAMDLYGYRHSVRNINPPAGYVLPHEDELGGDGNLLVNPAVKYSYLRPDLYPSEDDVPPVHIRATGSETYDWYVFPSEGPYNINIAFTLNKGSTDPTAPEKSYAYKDLPITNWRAEDIPALGRNQHITVTTRISKGLTVSFNFNVTDWTEHTASVEFD